MKNVQNITQIMKIGTTSTDISITSTHPKKSYFDILPSNLMFSDLISGGGDFLADGNFLGTSKCEGMLLLLWLVGLLANSCLTTGGNTVLLVITFLFGTAEDFPEMDREKGFVSEFGTLRKIAM